MGIFGKMGKLIGIEEVEEDEEITEAEIEEATAKIEGRKAIEPRNTFSAPPKPEVKPSVSRETKSSLSLTDKTGNFKLVVREPESFDECPKLVDNLKNHKPVIINLEKVESATARKIFDFLNGATYALNGNVQKIANNIFVFTPKNVDIAANTEHKDTDFASAAKSIWR